MDFNGAGVPSQVPCAKTPVNDPLSPAGLTCHAVTIHSQRSRDPVMQSGREQKPPPLGAAAGHGGQIGDVDRHPESWQQGELSTHLLGLLQ